ncbi:MAG: sirohydrochlorin cobaltochelatase [Bacteroidales bacterium]|jgi:sirohydrochlorin cobaltochelatase|nr:sirohydrochlorin cobaltochelatase [Bacteroidales bacterium]
MKKRPLTKVLTLVLLAAFIGAAIAKPKPNVPEATKRSILLVTFGSSYAQPHQTFKTIEYAARTHFAVDSIAWAYTSQFIIRKLREGRGQGVLAGKKMTISTPKATLEQMIQAGDSSFAVQSLHVIPGDEYDELLEAVEVVKAEHQEVDIKVGKPLLYSDEDITAVAKVLAAKFADAVQEGPVCFMGHGTPHIADDRYQKMQIALQKIHPHFYVATVEGTSFEFGESTIGHSIAAIDTISPKPRSVTITPLMSIAGDHANNDMNGVSGHGHPEEMSWREHLEASGYIVHDVMKGLGDYEEINAIWMHHLESVMD